MARVDRFSAGRASMTTQGTWAPPAPAAGTLAISSALRELERRLARADHTLFLAEWRMNTGRPSGGALRARLARARLLSHPRLLGWCDAAILRSSGGARRRLVLLRRQVVDAQLESHPSVARLNARIERRLLGFRPRWNGRPVSQAEIWDLVSREPDPARRRAGYYANEPLFVGLEPDVRALVDARNHRAQELGFASYPEARLSLEGLSVRSLRDLSAPVLALGRTASSALREASPTGSWFPWDMMFAQRQATAHVRRGFSAADCIPAVRAGLKKWGFGPADLAFRFRRWDTPTAGLALHGQLPADVGVVCNPRDGIVHYSVLFHEMGHGIHGRAVRGPSPLFRSVGFPGFAESIGGLFEQVTCELSWLRTRPGISAEEARRLRASSYAALAFRMAELVGEVESELRLYGRADADLTGPRRRFLHGTLGYDDHPPISWVDPYHLSPGFHRASYLLATCFTEQVVAAGKAATRGALWPNPRWGPWLKRTWLRPGQRDDWVPKVRKVTGKPLGPAAFVTTARQEMAQGLAG